MKGILSQFDGRFGCLDSWYFAYHSWRNKHAPAMFHKGWGNQAAIDAVSDQWQVIGSPATPAVAWDDEWRIGYKGVCVRNGHFPTPAHCEYLPPESHTAFFRFVRPQWPRGEAVALLMPASREVGVEARMPIARALAKRGISTVLLESPLMGRRQSPQQVGTMLSHFSDFLVLSACAINEGQSLIQWLGQMDFKAVCVAGISKGGYLATVAGMRSPDSVRIVSVVAPHSGVAVLLEGLLGRLCDWDLLQKSSGESKPVRQHMAEVFDRTSLERLPLPSEARRLIVIGATNDRYVPASSQQRMQSLWGDRADYRWLPGGHVSSIAESSHVIDAITEALALD